MRTYDTIMDLQIKVCIDTKIKVIERWSKNIMWIWERESCHKNFHKMVVQILFLNLLSFVKKKKNGLKPLVLGDWVCMGACVW